MRIIDAIPLIDAHLDANLPIMLEGPTGVGKSDLVRQRAAHRGWPIIDKFRASTLDPADIRGVPTIENGRTVFNPPDDFPNVERDGPVGIVFFDEIDTGTMAVQAALFGVVLDRQGLPGEWRIVAARNGAQFSRASQRLSQPLSARFGRAAIDPDMESWTLWATENGVLPEIIAFLRWSEARDNPLLSKMAKATTTRRSRRPAPGRGSRGSASTRQRWRSRLQPPTSGCRPRSSSRASWTSTGTCPSSTTSCRPRGKLGCLSNHRSSSRSARCWPGRRRSRT
jgi:hypothetical protein